MQLASNGLLCTKIFPSRIISSSVLSEYLKILAPLKRLGQHSRFTPNSLRTGGHTFYSIKNMNDDFLHFLGRRAISRVCQLYYRANAYDNIERLNLFFLSISRHHILSR